MKLWATADDFVKGLHCQGRHWTPRSAISFTSPRTTPSCSINSGYGGNVLLGKKCFALRIASYLGKNEGWMAEHMLILGIENPQGEIKYVAAAFPSACGKTNLAMLIPPEGYRKKGYKVWTRGRRHRLDASRRRRHACGPSTPRTASSAWPPAPTPSPTPTPWHTTKKGTIFTNVALNLDDNTVWWEGLDKNPPDERPGLEGRPLERRDTAEEQGLPIPTPASPLRQRTAPASAPEFDNPHGVPISAIIFGGRRAKTAPLVYQSRDWKHGVFVGSIMASETTAAATGAVGVVRRDPMAMLPFCGYHMGDYWQHWLDMGKKSGRQGSQDLQRQLVPHRRRTATSSGPASATTCACSSGS